MSIYNLIEYSDIIQKHQEFYSYTIDMNNFQTIMSLYLIFLPILITVLCLNFKKIAGKTVNDSTKNVEIFVPLKYLSKFWRTFKMSLTVKLISF